VWKKMDGGVRKRRAPSGRDPRYLLIRIPKMPGISSRAGGRFFIMIHKGMAFGILASVLLWGGIIKIMYKILR
jgi:hypothetical protein